MRLFCVSEQVFRIGYSFGLESIIKYCGRYTILSVKINTNWRARCEQSQPFWHRNIAQTLEFCNRKTAPLVAIKKCKIIIWKLYCNRGNVCYDDSFSVEKSMASAWSCHIKESWQCFPSSRLTEQTWGFSLSAIRNCSKDKWQAVWTTCRTTVSCHQKWKWTKN